MYLCYNTIIFDLEWIWKSFRTVHFTILPCLSTFFKFIAIFQLVQCFSASSSFYAISRFFQHFSDLFTIFRLHYYVYFNVFWPLNFFKIFHHIPAFFDISNLFQPFHYILTLSDLYIFSKHFSYSSPFF